LKSTVSEKIRRFPSRPTTSFEKEGKGRKLNNKKGEKTMDKKKMIYKAKKPNTPRDATAKASLRFFFFSFSKFTGVSTIQLLTIIYPSEFLSREEEGEAGYGIFAHSRPDKIGTARLLPLYIRNLHWIISKRNRSNTISCLQRKRDAYQ
jgi:hypothetical protein